MSVGVALVLYAVFSSLVFLGWWVYMELKLGDLRAQLDRMNDEQSSSEVAPWPY